MSGRPRSTSANHRLSSTRPDGSPLPRRWPARTAVSRERPPADGPSPTQPIITPVQDSGYALQVSALRDRNAAEQLAKRLTEKGYPAYVAIPLESTPVAMFTVRVGPFADRPEAEQVLERLESEDAFSPWITR